MLESSAQNVEPKKLSTRKQVKYRFFNYFNFRLIRNCLCLTKFTFH